MYRTKYNKQYKTSTEQNTSDIRYTIQVQNKIQETIQVQNKIQEWFKLYNTGREHNTRVIQATQCKYTAKCILVDYIYIYIYMRYPIVSILDTAENVRGRMRFLRPPPKWGAVRNGGRGASSCKGGVCYKGHP